MGRPAETLTFALLSEFIHVVTACAPENGDVPGDFFFLEGETSFGREFRSD